MGKAKIKKTLGRLQCTWSNNIKKDFEERQD
jgi:hypothetical protein